jgi:hypothetical protein
LNSICYAVLIHKTKIPIMRRINTYFNKQLTDIHQKYKQLETLARFVTQSLPADLAEHSSVGSFEQGCLTLTTQSPEWASQLRYHLPQLRDALRKDAGLYQLSSIKIAITNPPHTPPKKQPQHTLSLQAKNTILESSHNCSYQPLQQALMHLALGDECN